ncbi:hypothetical protein COV58_03670 [Candidatus Roizmanbacteria bacterium CG11_big_fil_rev_8_21_14_0_20_36_8]|uniref:histidine kinase n=2 Tax=Candidatus Roizmaniibacteriota TaxID=1752723 RepID=A0A2M6ITN8_9BACT|nr:MAG: hypothetical protein COV58_03670 [Candidatus Roizmanbacteria bacterium CG11_big_fil_rev_8_21_14_0_20_36_8]PIZ65677.1 MAG: hypothetical protein COY14_01800 [Candidatus Roizmanbacteria bacterium CG_4_10_14_0_2_um_filter_36_9]
MFHKARIKLTFWYLLIIMLVSITFSGVIYGFATNEVNRFAAQQRRHFQEVLDNDSKQIIVPGRGLRQMPRILEMENDEELISEVKTRTLISLAALNLIILLMSGIFGYLLAGKTLKPIQEMVDDQNRFISDASHEFKTPLTTLKTTFEVYLRKKKSKLSEAKKIIKESIESVDTLSYLSTSLLTLVEYKTNSGNLFTKIDISSSLNSAINRTKVLASEKECKIIKKISMAIVKGNDHDMIKLFVILIDNAIKYSSNNSSINITLKKMGKFAEIRVIDTGLGINKKDLSRIFDRFYRADNARSAVNSIGFGLGLSIAKEIVERHHGSLTANSKLGVGTTLIVRIPLIS